MQKKRLFWRCILIISEVIVGSFLIAAVIGGNNVPLRMGAFLTVSVGVVWIFLFFGSPFLVRTQGWLAILGWAVAAGALLIPPVL